MTCDCCGHGGASPDVRRVRVVPRDPANPINRLALCRGCLTRSGGTWHRRWKLAAQA